MGEFKIYLGIFLQCTLPPTGKSLFFRCPVIWCPSTSSCSFCSPCFSSSSSAGILQVLLCSPVCSPSEIYFFWAFFGGPLYIGWTLCTSAGGCDGGGGNGFPAGWVSLLSSMSSQMAVVLSRRQAVNRPPTTPTYFAFYLFLFALTFACSIFCLLAGFLFFVRCFGSR